MDGERKVWNGAAAIIIAGNKLLMVKGKESMGWSVPSGGMEEGESPDQACIREVWEETGFQVEIVQPLHIKKAIVQEYDVALYYFLCKVANGQISYHDPDKEIEEIAWKTANEIAGLRHDYPEDRDMLLGYFQSDSIHI